MICLLEVLKKIVYRTAYQISGINVLMNRVIYLSFFIYQSMLCTMIITFSDVHFQMRVF